MKALWATYRGRQGTAGAQSAGAQSAGARSAGAQSAGAQSAGAQAARRAQAARNIAASQQVQRAAALLLACALLLASLLGPAGVFGPLTATTAWADAADVAETNVVNPRQTPDNSFLYDTSIDELINADSSYQGKTVQVTGEVVGDSIVAEEDPGMHWITVESLAEGSSSSVSVLIDDSYLELIDTYGAYGKVGTTLQIRGTYHLTCPSHEGIMDIHAEEVKLVDAGRTIDQPLRVDQFTPGIAFIVLGLGLTLIYARLREKER